MRTRSLSALRLGAFVLALSFFVPAAAGQMPQPGQAQTLSSSDVSDDEIQKVARVLVSAQMSVRDEQMQMRKDMIKMKKNMASMDSTEKAKKRRELRKRQMAMRKKQRAAMQKEAKKEGMKPQRVMTIARSARQDSTLQERLRTAMKSEMMNQRQQGGGPPSADSSGMSGGSGQ